MSLPSSKVFSSSLPIWLRPPTYPHLSDAQISCGQIVYLLSANLLPQWLGRHLQAALCNSGQHQGEAIGLRGALVIGGLCMMLAFIWVARSPVCLLHDSLERDI
jgi:hypothetical protein